MAIPAQRGRSPMICRYEMPQGILAGKPQVSATAPLSPPMTALSLTLQTRQPTVSPLSGRQPNRSPPPRSANRPIGSSPSTPMAPPPIAASGYAASRLITRQASEVTIGSQPGSHVAAPMLGHGGQSTPSLSPSPSRVRPWGAQPTVSPPTSPSPIFATATKLVPSGSPPVARRGRAAMPGTVQQHGSYSLSASSSSPALPIFSGGSSARATVAVPTGSATKPYVPGAASSVSMLPGSSRCSSVQKSPFEQAPLLGGSSSSRAVSPLSPSPSPVRPASVISASVPKTVHPPKAANTAATSKQSLSYDSLLRIDDRRPRDASPVVDTVSNSRTGQAASTEPGSPVGAPAGTPPTQAAMPMAYLPTTQHRPPPTSMRMPPAQLRNRSGSLSSLTSRRKAKAAARSVLSKTAAPANPRDIQTILRRVSTSPNVKGPTGGSVMKSASALAPVSSTEDLSKSRTVVPLVESTKRTAGVKPSSLDSVLSTSCERLKPESAPIMVSQALPPPKLEMQKSPLDGSVRVTAQASGDAATQPALQVATRVATVDSGRGRSPNSQVVLVADTRPRSSGDVAPRRSSALPSPELKARRAGVYSTPDMRHRRTSSTIEVEANSELDDLSPLPSCVVRRTSMNALKEHEGDVLLLTSTQAPSGVITEESAKAATEEPGLGDTASSSRTCEPAPDMSGRFEPVPETAAVKTAAAITTQPIVTAIGTAPTLQPKKLDPSLVVKPSTAAQPLVTAVSAAPAVVPVKYAAALPEVTAQNGDSKPEASPVASPVSAAQLVGPAVAAPVITAAASAPAVAAPAVAAAAPVEPVVTAEVAAPAVTAGIVAPTVVLVPSPAVSRSASLGKGAAPIVATAVVTPVVSTAYAAPAGPTAPTAGTTTVITTGVTSTAVPPAITPSVATVVTADMNADNTEVSTGIHRCSPAPATVSIEVLSPPVVTPPSGDPRSALLHDVRLDLGNIDGSSTFQALEQPDTDVTLVSQRTELLPEEAHEPAPDSPERQCALITEDILSRHSVGKMDESQGAIVPSEIFKNLSEELQSHMWKQKKSPPQTRRSERNSRVLTGP
mmetsp:Transcript_78262/g.143240  ORF Transcript_78262/g.143240 Transcript_78262/m.143240 type:complete len:1067 (+) Transcript_78262:89-3289(+)